MITIIVSIIVIIIFCIFIALQIAKSKSKFNSIEFYNLETKIAASQIAMTACSAIILFFNPNTSMIFAISYIMIAIINHIFSILCSHTMAKNLKEIDSLNLK